MPSLLTVILNWRTPEMTRRSAEAALAALEGIEGALVIVDNASGDGSYERLAAEAETRGWTTGPQRVRSHAASAAARKVLRSMVTLSERGNSC